MSMTMKLSESAMLELEMANARGGNDWLDALETAGNDLLHDAQIGHRLMQFAKQIIRGEYGPSAATMTLRLATVAALKSQIKDLRRQLKASGDAYERLENASNVQKHSITSLRQALLHLSQGDHADSDGCNACRRVRQEIKAALAELSPPHS